MVDTPSQKNGVASLLNTLAQSGDKMIQFGILAMVGLSGLGNFLATKNDGGETRTQLQEDRQTAYRYLKDMHDEMDNFEKRQKSILDNQTRILENDGVVIRDTHEIVEQFKRWKQLEQMRGAPSQ